MTGTYFPHATMGSAVLRGGASPAGFGADFNSIPEPSTLVLAGAALLGLAVFACNRGQRGRRRYYGLSDNAEGTLGT